MLDESIDEKMRKVVKWFYENNHNASQMITRGKKQGLTEKQTLSGMARVYERHEQGEIIKPINMAWMAWEEAKKAKDANVVNFMFNRTALMKQVKRLQKWTAVAFLVGVFALLASWFSFFMYLEYFHRN